MLTTVGVVGVRVVAVRNTVAVPIPLSRPVVPAAVALYPVRRAIGIAGTRALPVSANPDVAVAVVAPAPMPRSPDITIAWSGDPLVAWRGRSGIDVDLDLAGRRAGQRRRRGAERSGGNQRGNQDLFRKHGTFPPRCWLKNSSLRSLESA